ncbi:uncharacterized protein LOC126747392 [Anthonomus grandis grandis]|uniref:uncharacterized protein LOC126747392 n=1 Tax=Anthonomus grandis grandis TaxID=2921223 RepID=UPI00216517D9|nr:uncharacterized protein LOC126747392 [Anthonomus grandis grandis]
MHFLIRVRILPLDFIRIRRFSHGFKNTAPGSPSFSRGRRNRYDNRRRIRVLSSSSDEELFGEEEEQRGEESDRENIEPPLDVNLLELLGPNIANNDVEGSSIQKDLANRWEAILCKVLNAEDRNSIISEYPIPKNCQSLISSKINRIVSAAINEFSTRRDIKLALVQTQMGAAASAVGLALSLLLKDGREENKPIIKQLSDASRLMADLFYNQSQYRRELLLSNLNKNLRKTLEKSEISSWLFGDNLEEEIKTSKTLQRSSEELKPTSSTSRKILRPLNLRGLPRANSGFTRGRQAFYNPQPNPRHQQRPTYNQPDRRRNRNFFLHRQQEKNRRSSNISKQTPLRN